MTPTRAGLALLGAVALGACTRTVVVRTAPPPSQRPTEPERPGPSTAVTLGIPPGHLPQPGECRIWIPGTPPGQQPGTRSRPCAGIAALAPAGSWIVYRPSRDRRVVHVRLVDARRAGLVIRVRFFDYDTGRLLREGRPEESPDERGDESGYGRRGNPPRERPTEPPPAPLPPPPPPPVEPAPLNIPPGQMPEPGECRIWLPGMPPGLQPAPRSRPCPGIAVRAPAGSWIVYRPTRDRRVVHIRVVDSARNGVVIRVRFFDYETGRFLREGSPDESPDEEAAPDSTRGRPDQRERGKPEQERPVPPPERPIERPQERPVEPPPGPVVPPPERPIERPVTPVIPPPPPPPPPAEKPTEQPPAPSASLDIPPGQLPEVGACRVWNPHAPPGRQPRPKSRSCEGIAAAAPAGSWIVFRPSDDRQVVHVRVIDERRAGVVIRVRIFDLASGKLLREENP